MFENADLIHRYTHADAIRDSLLIDVSAVAREAGIRYPVAITRAVWERCVAVPPGVLCQDEAGRLTMQARTPALCGSGPMTAEYRRSAGVVVSRRLCWTFIPVLTHLVGSPGW